MKVGTKSLLFGVHQFIWHPYTVLRAWIHLYGCPTWREFVCIVIHDWGYWGCADMDGETGADHPWFASKIAMRLFDIPHARLVLFHSRNVAKRWQQEPSRLCWADKYSMLYDPRWFYLLRARLSGEIAEYRANAAERLFVDRSEPDAVWFDKLTTHLGRMAKAHAIADRQTVSA